MDQIEQTQPENTQDTTMKLRHAFGIWCGFIFLWFALMSLASHWHMFTALVVIAYFVIGIYLNRKVLPRLIYWHPTYNTLANVTSEKIKLFLFWPFTYLFLFLKLGIDKLL